MKHGAEFGRKEEEEEGENKGGTQEGGECSVVCGFQQKNYLCLLAEMVLLLKGPWPPSKNWVFPRGKLGAWQAGVCVYSALPSLLRGLGFGGGCHPERVVLMGTPHSGPAGMLRERTSSWSLRLD